MERTVGHAVVVLSFVACARTPAPPPPPISAPQPQLVVPEPSGWPYWQALPLELHPRPEFSEVWEEKSEPAWLASDEEWRTISAAVVARLRTTRSVVHRIRSHDTSIGRFYEDRARRGAPVVITLDALFALAHVLFASVASDVETVMATQLGEMLHRLELRLGAEAPRARPDLREGYRIARTAVAVALSLSEPAYVVPADLTDVASSEAELVRSHSGLATSPLFGVPVDYGAFSPRGPIASPADPRAGVFKAAQWLGEAPFLFEGKNEPGGVSIDVGVARSQARAALLLARLLYKNGDVVARTAFARVMRVDRFTLGETDDLSPRNVSDLARRAGIDLQGGDELVDTFKVDRFRHLASRGGEAVEPSLSRGADGGAQVWGGSTTMRVVPLRAPPDGRVLQRLVTPFIGPLSAPDAGQLAERRLMPSALDVGAWLGSAVAKGALVTRGDFGYEGFDGALQTLLERRPSAESKRHASVYGSWLDALATSLRPSLAEEIGPHSLPVPDDRRRLRTAIVVWTLLRHDALPFAHDAPHARPTSPSQASQGPGVRPGVRVFIDPHPEAIAGLLGAVRQLLAGLTALGALRDDALSLPISTEVDSLLTLALDGSARQANLDPRFAELLPELAQIPSRIAAVEAWAGLAADPVVIDVHLDATSGSVLEEATGALEEVFLRVRDPVTHRLVIAVGATIPHEEFLASAASRLSDAAWRERIRSGQAPEGGATIDPDRVE